MFADPLLAGRDDRVPHLEESVLQTGTGISRLSYAQFHH